MRPLALLPLLCLCAAANAVYGLRDPSGVLTLDERITDNGDGTWDYAYTLANLGAVENVWWWGVYLGFDQGANAQATGFDQNAAFVGSTPDDIRYYDYPGVAYAFETAYFPLSSGGGFGTGESSTMSFTASALDTSEKVFFADVLGEWSGEGTIPYDFDGTQGFSYLSGPDAVPEPATLAALGLGALALRRRRKG